MNHCCPLRTQCCQPQTQRLFLFVRILL